MKKMVWLGVLLVLTLGLCACGSKAETAPVEEAPVEQAPTWQEQYDLGIRYLSEGNYKEAIIAFEAAIKIDPKQPDTYLKAAEAYEALGDIDSAIVILEQGANATQDTALQEKLEALREFSDVTVVPEIPEMLAWKYADGTIYTRFWPQYYTKLPEDAIRVFDDIITAGLAGDQDYLCSNIMSDLLWDTAVAYCTPDGYWEYHEEERNGRIVTIWTTVDSAWLCYSRQIYDDRDIVRIEYRPESGTAFHYSYFVDDYPHISYTIGHVEGHLFNGAFTKYFTGMRRIHDFGHIPDSRKHTGTAVNELIHGDYISEHRSEGFSDSDYNYTEYRTYENGYIQSCWQDENGNLLPRKRVGLDGSVEYWDVADEEKELVPVLRYY